MFGPHNRCKATLLQSVECWGYNVVFVSLLSFLFRVKSFKSVTPSFALFVSGDFCTAGTSHKFVYLRMGSNQRIFEYNDPFVELLYGRGNNSSQRQRSHHLLFCMNRASSTLNELKTISFYSFGWKTTTKCWLLKYIVLLLCFFCIAGYLSTWCIMNQSKSL